MEQISDNGVQLIIVLYNPTADDIANVESMGQRYRGAVVDNSAEPFTNADMIGLMHYVCNRENKGIAEAQNIGIDIVLAEGAQRLVFLDQDSRTGHDYPTLIAREFDAAKASVPHLALLGPTVVRKDNGEEYRSAIHKDTYVGNHFIPRKNVISSGCCIDADAMRNVGPNDARMFIDYVDYEWCWRAASKGFACGITPNVSIAHKVGMRELHIGRQVVIISKPFRYFYQYRNYLWLLRRKYVPLQWKIATGIKFALRLIYFPIFVQGGCERWKYMVKGIMKSW